jgi:hypothetical protein
VKNLEALIEKLALVVAEGEQIYLKAGGSKDGAMARQVEAAGETEHLERVKALGGQLWRAALAYTAPLCKEKRIAEQELRHAYGQAGIFSEGTAGAHEVAQSIISGQDACPEDYYPIGHLRGMLAALRTILE